MDTIGATLQSDRFDLDAATQPAFIDPTPFVHEQPDGTSRLDLIVRDAHCAACLRKIESSLLKLPGIISARLNLTTKKLLVIWEQGVLAPIRITETLHRLGFTAAPCDTCPDGATQRREERFLLRCLAVSGAAAANIMLFSVSLWFDDGEMGAGTRGFLIWLSALLALPAIAYAGQPFFRSAAKALRSGRVNMDVPISLAVLLAAGLSLFEAFFGGGETYFEAAVTLVFLLLIGRYLDLRLRGEARSAAGRLAALRCVSANRIEPSGAIRPVAVRDIVPGDRVRVGIGERIPINGVVIDGRSTLDASIITGETAPAEAGAGTTVYSGAINLLQPLTIEATASYDNSLLAEITRLVETGEQTRSRYVRLSDKAAELYVPLVHGLALATFAAWFFLAQAGLHHALTNAIAVLIITCPCALGLAVPAVQVVATGRLFDRGILVKSGDALERLAEIDTVVLDKTGTLTAPHVLEIDRKNISPADLERAAMLARASRHPLARALAAAAGPGPAATNVREDHGHGLEAIIDNQQVRLGSRTWCGVTDHDEAESPELWFRVSGQRPFKVSFCDVLRPDAPALVRELRIRHLRLYLISGDHAKAVERVARETGIGDWISGATPARKHSILESFRAGGHKVLMVGDGLNDAPALASAHVSIAPAHAIDASQAAADLVLQKPVLNTILEAIDSARAARARSLENLGFSALYNLCAIPLAVSGLVTPLIAAVAMSASSLAVTLNALRLMKTGQG